ncbi:MAG TPA: ISL3 family transposase [Candidatus Paceibacterota bacterium]|nr:ISL3 family transposase [Candidatus Paceibacterota bacterium]
MKKNQRPTTQVEVKTILNRIQHFVGFVYQSIQLRGSGGTLRLEVRLEAHRGIRGKCASCMQPAPGYDRLEERRWLFVPLWGIRVHFFYAPRRVQCPEHGVGVEHIPWSQGKRPVTTAMMGFLARWARRLSWRETARTFQTRWEAVYHSVAWFVEWGLAHRQLEAVRSLGVDEIHWGQGKRANQFLTVIYQIDGHCRRLLWVGRRRTQATLRRGLAALGPAVVSGLRFVCSDMWQPYLAVMAQQAGQALHILDRFHITQHLNQAVDKVRRAESTRLHGKPLAAKLKKMRWKLLRRGSRVRGQARIKLHGLLASKLATGRAWDLKECFDYFWHYKSIYWAGGFLDYWTERAMRSRLEPMKKVARMMRKHEPLLLNWFKAKGQVSSGVVEGLNNKIRVVTRRSYGFRTFKAMEIALYHNLGKLPEPESTHRFC